MDQEIPSARVRIGELGRRVGVSDHVLRAWERRYGLLQPERSTGGYRLYSAADERRIRGMQAHLAAGLSAAEAARATLSEERAGPPQGHTGSAGDDGVAGPAQDLADRLDRLDEPGAQAALDRLFARFTTETVLRDTLLPYLHHLGDRWERGQASIANEHFASNLLRGRLAGLARGWGYGHGPCAILACPPGEQHDMGLLMFGIMLHRCGWRVEYLGASTPIAELARTGRQAHADIIVLAAAIDNHFDEVTDDLAQLARQVPLALAGAGATQTLADQTGARLLTGDPVTEAQRLPPPGDAEQRQRGMPGAAPAGRLPAQAGLLAAAAQEPGSPGARNTGRR
jgi:DNA-binding transcriptional MerR regulator